jgi:hypothetical protein
MTTYCVDVYRTLATIIEVEADTAEAAAEIAESTNVQFTLQDLTDDVEVIVSGTVENGERKYFF